MLLKQHGSDQVRGQIELQKPVPSRSFPYRIDYFKHPLIFNYLVLHEGIPGLLVGFANFHRVPDSLSDEGKDMPSVSRCRFNFRQRDRSPDIGAEIFRHVLIRLGEAVADLWIPVEFALTALTPRPVFWASGRVADPVFPREFQAGILAPPG